MADSQGRDFFISYTQVNRPWAEWIAVQLEAAGYTTLLQAWDFRPGSDFVHEIQQATTSAGRTIAVLSPAYFGSEFSEAEWRAQALRAGCSVIASMVAPLLDQHGCSIAGSVTSDAADAGEPEFVIFMGRWLAGGSGRCGRGPAVGAATATRRRYELVPDAGRLAGRSKLGKAAGVRKAVISWICASRRVSTSMARGVKVWVLSSQA